jgi:TetR/AcrR family transcriptional repressor of nem operon
MGAQPSTDRGRRTRQRIVVAATEVVAEKGALGASLDEVGARAPASRSQLYHYFDAKNDL